MQKFHVLFGKIKPLTVSCLRLKKVDKSLFQDTNSCHHCNGSDYSNSNRNQPLCSSCHSFLISAKRKRRSNAFYGMGPKLKDLRKFFDEIVERTPPNESDSRPSSTVVSVEEPTTDYKSDTHISALPDEMISNIFSYLNENTLVNCVSRVSKHWRMILGSQQEKWKMRTMKRWPLLKRVTAPSNWLEV